VGSRGQDGRLLSELLEGNGYQVHGLIRAGLESRETRETAIDLLDANAVRTLISDLKPDEIYYLAAYHHSSESARPPEMELFKRSFEVNVYGLLNVLEAVREVSPSSRVLYAASSHVFGDGASSPQDEETPLAPTNIYGISKTAGILACRHYRDRNGVFASDAILYNHESPFRAPDFVSSRIIGGALDIKHCRTNRLVLGNLSAEVDWGYGPDTVDGMWRILQLPDPGEFVVATGELHSVQEFVEIVFDLAGLDWKSCVAENPEVIQRPQNPLRGNPRRLREKTGWKPSLTFREMVTRLWEEASKRESQ